MDDSRAAMAFATEPIGISLSNLLGNRSNLSDGTGNIHEFELDELEVSLFFHFHFSLYWFIRQHSGKIFAFGFLSHTFVLFF